MISCGMHKILFRLIPLNGWRAFLIQKHFENCPRCRLDLASRDEVLTFLVQENEVDEICSFEGPYEANAGEAKKRQIRISVSKLRFAWTAAGLAILFLAAFFFLGHPFSLWRQEGKGENGRFQLHYVKVDNRPAQAYLFHPQGTDLVIIWAEGNTMEDPNGET
ncbi:MAG: hypothetical protein JXB26_19550 [Candidatus Aminicenantes bacterium]|nr:hypothetical protein [Candidatus Aminicenantes bacterium]